MAKVPVPSGKVESLEMAGPAQPYIIPPGEALSVEMALRDRFAMAALMAINPRLAVNDKYEFAAACAYQMADAMIAERAKK